MHTEQPTSAHAVEVVQRTLGERLMPGQLGVLMAWAGVGKTACLIHIALDHLLRGEPVLHVSIGQTPDKVKVWYHEFLKNTLEGQGERFAGLQHRIEPLRSILSYTHQTFSPEKLEQSLQNLEDQAKFKPATVILDGLDFDKVSRSTVEALQSLAQRHGVSLWMSARTHRHIDTTNTRGIPYPCHECDDIFHAVVLLEPKANAIQVRVLKHNDRYNPEHPEVLLNPQTYLLQKE